MPTIEEWVQRCADGRSQGQQIPVASLFREIIRADGWLAACSQDGMVGTSGGLADVYCGAVVFPELQQMSGLAMVGSLASDLRSLRLHSARGASPLELSAEEIEDLRGWVGVAVVEALLQRLHDGEDLQVSSPFSRLREFSGYYILCTQAQNDIMLKMALVPEPNSCRKLVAAFTAQDALQRFVLSQQKELTSEYISVRLSGVELFTRLLSNDEPLDGVVFNPAGPTQPLALAKEVAGIVTDTNRA